MTGTAPLRSLTAALEEGLNLAERLKWQTIVNQREETGNVEPIEISEFAFRLANRVEVLKCGPFSVWATDQEKNILLELVEYSERWNRDFAKSLLNENPVPSFDEFLNNIKSVLQKISSYIQKTL